MMHTLGLSNRPCINKKTLQAKVLAGFYVYCQIN